MTLQALKPNAPPELLRTLKHRCGGTVVAIDLDERGVGQCAFCTARAHGGRPNPALADAPEALKRLLLSPRGRRLRRWAWVNPEADAFVPGADDLRAATLEALPHLLRRGIGVTLRTRGGLPQADGLVTLGRRHRGLLRVEIGFFSADPEQQDTWERGVASVSARLGLAAALKQAGATVVGRIGPLIPLVNDEERGLRKLSKLLASRGIRTLVPEWIEDGPGLVKQVEREVSRSRSRILNGWFELSHTRRGEPRRLNGEQRRDRLERLRAAAEPLCAHVIACACSIEEGEEACLTGPEGVETRQADLFGATG